MGSVTTNSLPFAMAVTFLAAMARNSSSLPSTRVMQAPEASLKAMPNFICGTVSPPERMNRDSPTYNWLEIKGVHRGRTRRS